MKNLIKKIEAIDHQNKNTATMQIKDVLLDMCNIIQCSQKDKIEIEAPDFSDIKKQIEKKYIEECRECGVPCSVIDCFYYNKDFEGRCRGLNNTGETRAASCRKYFPITICDGCKNEVYPDCCCCGGNASESHDHPFVPVGCTCYSGGYVTGVLGKIDGVVKFSEETESSITKTISDALGLSLNDINK